MLFVKKSATQRRTCRSSKEELVQTEEVREKKDRFDTGTDLAEMRRRFA